LGLTHTEAHRLFAAKWPVRWLLKVGVSPHLIKMQKHIDDATTMVPTAREAVAVLRAMAEEGKVWHRTGEVR